MSSFVSKIPTVSMCCCFDLKIGGLILGWFDTIIYGFIVFVSLAILSGALGEDFDDEGIPVGFRADMAVHFVFALFLFCFAVRFLIGVYNDDPRKCRAYVIVNTLSLVIYLIAGILTFNVLILGYCVLKAYFVVVIYSVYVSMSFEGGHAAFAAFKHAGGSGGYQPSVEKPKDAGHQPSNTGGFQTTNAGVYQPNDYKSTTEQGGYQASEYQGP